MQQELIKIKQKIDSIKQELLSIGEMRPGSLTLQYRDLKQKQGAYYQISYTLNMKSRTDYVRKEFIYDLRQQIKNYRKFKRLTKLWTDLAIKYSKFKIDFETKKM